MPTIKRFLTRYGFLILTFCLSTPAAEIRIILDEEFSGPNRTTQNLPQSAAWFSGTASSHLVHDSENGSLGLISAPTSSRHIIAYLTTPCEPIIKLKEGDDLLVEYTIHLINPNTTDITVPSNSFRIGLFDSQLAGTGVQRIEADNLGGVSGTNSSSFFDSYVGYRVDSILHSVPTVSPARFFRRQADSTGAALLVLTTAYTPAIANSGPAVDFIDGIYHGQLRITNNGGQGVSFYHRLAHEDPEMDIQLEVSGVDTSVDRVTTFDTLAFGINSRVAEGFTLKEVTVIQQGPERIEIDFGSRTVSTTLSTPDGTPVVPMWKSLSPTDNLRAGAGFPILESAEHAVVWQPASLQDGAYNHYGTLEVYEDRFFAMWGNHPLGEDGPGQRILFSYSDEWGVWSEPQELFPPPGPILPREEQGIHLKPDQWMVIDGNLYAVVFVFEAGSYAIGRRVHFDGTFDNAFVVFNPVGATHEPPVFMDGVPEPEYAADSALKINNWYSENSEVSWWGRLVSTGQNLPRNAVDGATLIETFSYRAKDGHEVLFARNWGHNSNPVHNNRLYVSFRDGQGGWATPYPTNIPDSPSRADAVTLPNGTVLLIGNQNVSELDQPVYLDRDPMTISISEDGYNFRRVFALRTGSRSHFRFPGVGGRNHGFAYSQSLIHEGFLYTFYSVSKEDMEITRVPLSHMGLSDEIPEMYDIRYQIGPGGWIRCGLPEQQVLSGRFSTSVEVEGLNGAVFKSWSDGRVDNPRMDQALDAPLEVSAQFATLAGTPIAWYDDNHLAPNSGESWNDLDFMDSDGGGIPNWKQFIAGTDPNNPTSRFQIKALEVESGLTFHIEPSRIDRRYAIQFSEDLSPDSWQVLAGFSNLQLEQGVSTIYVELPEAPRGFFRIQVSLPEE